MAATVAAESVPCITRVENAGCVIIVAAAVAAVQATATRAAVGHRRSIPAGVGTGAAAEAVAGIAAQTDRCRVSAGAQALHAGQGSHAAAVADRGGKRADSNFLAPRQLATMAVDLDAGGAIVAHDFGAAAMAVVDVAAALIGRHQPVA